MAKRITEFTSATSLAEGDLLPVVDISDTTQATSGTTKKSAISLIVVEVLKKAYPIGSVYINASNSTNPASLLGFGTWVAFGAGKVMVGLDAGDTSFDTVGETGGEKTHTLTVAEMPSHSHTTTLRWGGTLGADGINDNSARMYGGTTDTTTFTTGSAGSGGSHNNLQPYIVFNYIIKT